MKVISLESLIEKAEKEKVTELTQEDRLRVLDSLVKAAVESKFDELEKKSFIAPDTNKEPKPWVPCTNPIAGTRLWIHDASQVMNPPQVPVTDFKVTYSTSGKDLTIRVS